MRRRDDGFTLIELMVVVLILGILLAIAIPNFLGLTTSAQQNGVESNLQIASMDENMYLTKYGVYGTATASASGPAMSAVDSGITWHAYSGAFTEPGPTKDVYVDMTTGANGTPAIYMGGGSNRGTYYWVYQDNAAGTVEYAATNSGSVPALSAFSASWAAANAAA